MTKLITTRGSELVSMEQRLKEIAKQIDTMLPEGINFTIVIFNEQFGYGGYQSNVKAHPIQVKALRECATSIEKKIEGGGQTGQIILN